MVDEQLKLFFDFAILKGQCLTLYLVEHVFEHVFLGRVFMTGYEE